MIQFTLKDAQFEFWVSEVCLCLEVQKDPFKSYTEISDGKQVVDLFQPHIKKQLSVADYNRDCKPVCLCRCSHEKCSGTWSHVYSRGKFCTVVHIWSESVLCYLLCVLNITTSNYHSSREVLLLVFKGGNGESEDSPLMIPDLGFKLLLKFFYHAIHLSLKL